MSTLHPMLPHYFAELAAIKSRETEIMTEIKKIVIAMPLHGLLSQYLNEKAKSLRVRSARNQLWRYLDRRYGGGGSGVQLSSMHKYFSSNPNINHVPPPDFIEGFAAFVGISSEARDTLMKLRDMAEVERRGTPRARVSKPKPSGKQTSNF